jgi:hypothetical protein
MRIRAAAVDRGGYLDLTRAAMLNVDRGCTAEAPRRGKAASRRGEAMAYNIRPLSFAEVLDRSFQVLRDNFVLLAGISLVVWVPYGVLMEFASPRSLGTMIFAAIFLWVATPLATAAATFAIAERFLDRETTIPKAYQSVFAIFAPLAGTYLLAGFFILLGVLALVIPGVYLGVCWYFLLVVMVIERRFGMATLGRSRSLVRGNWWPTFGIIIAASLIAAVPSWGINLVWAYLPVVGPILNATTQGVFLTYPTIVAVIYYFDRRCRLEDFDLRLLAEQIRAEGAPGAADVSQAATIG